MAIMNEKGNNMYVIYKVLRKFYSFFSPGSFCTSRNWKMLANQ